MSHRNLFVLFCILVATFAFGQTAQKSAHADIVNAQGQKIGTAIFSPAGGGVKIDVDVNFDPATGWRKYGRPDLLALRIDDVRMRRFLGRLPKSEGCDQNAKQHEQIAMRHGHNLLGERGRAFASCCAHQLKSCKVVAGTSVFELPLRPQA